MLDFLLNLSLTQWIIVAVALLVLPTLAIQLLGLLCTMVIALLFTLLGSVCGAIQVLAPRAFWGSYNFAYGKMGSLYRTLANRDWFCKARSISSDPWKVLDVRRGASKDEIQARYRDLVLRNHPDRISHMDPFFQRLANERVRKITDAYQAILRSLS